MLIYKIFKNNIRQNKVPRDDNLKLFYVNADAK